MLNLQGRFRVGPKYSLKRARIVDKYTLNDGQLTHPDQIPDYIFNKLMIVDYHVREFELSNEANINYDPDHSDDEDEIVDADEAQVHPMDALLGIFHSSDNLLRRYIATRLSECQLSVPFLLPNPKTAPSENVTMLLSALENIKKSWKSGESVLDVFATEHPFPVVSFIRLGQPTMSKSSLINKLITCDSTDGRSFFHRDMKGGNVKRKVVDGLVELIWYLPAGRKEQVLNREICFANLRGDASSSMLKKQLNILSKISSILCILLPSGLPGDTMQDILKRCTDNDTKTILLFNHERTEKSAKEYFEKLQSNSNGKLSLITKAEQSNEYKFFQAIRGKIRRRIDGANARPLVELASQVDELGIRLEEDQINSGFRQIIDSLLKKGIERMKNLMTLQTHIPLLAKLEREMYRPKRHGNRFIKKDNNEIYQQIAEIKDAQETTLVHLDEEVLSCLEYITRMDEFERHKALNMLKHQLELRRSQSSLGLEHIIRELAQLYQIKKQTNGSTYDYYASAAADILLSGQPLELVDGDSFYIPLEWFKAVFQELKQKTKDAKIFVVSVVGIQSSGKSTMLNTMFGLEFPVSAGRCTNGIFVSLIPVSDSLKSNSKFDYVLVVDTEGLRGSSNQQVRERDNELVAFAIGLADVTIVNIKDENATQMEDFLGVAVHAFLKMKLVEESHKMSCRIVHQMVAASDAREKLADDRSNFMNNLDEMTKIAATQENCDNKYKKFNDVISFNKEEDVFYLPSRQLGNPPMARVNPEYGKGVQKIKNGILDLMCSKESFHHSVSNFQKRVTDVWNALLEEHFIFSLRNTFELRARRSLDEKYLEVSVSIDTGMAELEEQIDVALRRCSTVVEREKEWAESKKKISSKAERLGKEMEEAMDSFFESDKDSGTLDKWRGAISEDIKKEKKRQVTKVKDHCSKTFTYLRRLHDIEEKQITYQAKVMEKAKEFIISVHDFENKTKLKAIFAEEWQRWISDVPELQEDKIDINAEMVSFLHEKDSVESEQKLAELNNIISNFQNCSIAADDLVYKINIVKKWLKGDKIKRECLLLARAIKEEVVVSAKNISDSGVRFSRDSLEKLYDIVITTTDKKTETYPFEFTKSSKWSILIFTFAQSDPLFNQMEERYLEERDIRGNLERNLRPELEKYFENIYDKRSQRDLAGPVLAALFFVNVLEKEIESALNRTMGRVVSELLSRGTAFKNKGKFHAEILIKLGEEGNFKSYVRYLEDPVEFLKTKLKESIENYCLDKILPSIVSLYENEVNKIKINVLRGIQIANEKTKTEKGKLTFWIQQFVEACPTLVVKKEMFAVAAIQNLDEIDGFQQKVCDNLDIRVTSLIQGGVNRATFRKWNPSPHESIINEMFACQCLCPFCKALCDGNKCLKTHSAESHRPVGIIGLRHEKTGKLSTNICTESVAGDKTFKNLDTLGESCYYREYRSVNDYYNSWVITGNKSLKPSMYWKWFMATFWKELADKYEATPEKPNFFWRFITFKDAKEQLISQYDL